MSAARVLLVEDDSFTRVALSGALKERNVNVVASVASALDALNSAQQFNPNIALLDLDLGVGPNGIDIAIALRKKNPIIGIILLTSYRDPRLAVEGMPPIPEGSILLNKTELRSMSMLTTQIEAALMYPTRRRIFEWSRSGNFQSLSNTQVEILRTIADGLTTADIASQRGVSVQAIEKTIARICKKLEIPTNSKKNQRVALVRAYFYGAGKEL